MENSIKISIVRPGKQTLKTEGISLQIPGYDGSIGIMHNRQPLVTLMDSGLICIKSFNGKKSYFAVSGGFAEIQDNVATLLCDSIITPEDLPEINMETTGEFSSGIYSLSFVLSATTEFETKLLLYKRFS